MSQFPNTKNTSIEKRAKSVEEAIAEAIAELGVNKEDANIEIIQEPSKGFLGLGAKEAVVKVSVQKKLEEIPIEKEVEEVSKDKPEEVITQETAQNVSEVFYNSESPAENAQNFISDILTAMGLDVKVSAVLEGDIVKINLEGENMGIVIGKRGDTLDSLQYLTSLVINRNSNDYVKVSIDTENYREKRSEALISLSDRLAEKVTRSGKKFALEPMNPYERRIIHANLQESETVTTYSVGQEPYRKVIIAPKNPKPYKRGYGKKSYNKNKGDRNRSSGRGGYKRSGYDRNAKKPETTTENSATYKADFKPQPRKAEFKNFDEYLAAYSKD